MEDLINQLKILAAKKTVKDYDELIEVITASEEFEILNEWYIMLLLEHFVEYDFVKNRMGERRNGIIERIENCRRNKR